MTIGIGLKLYFDVARTRAWTDRIVEITEEFPAVQDGRLVCWIVPTLPAVPMAIDRTAHSRVGVGAQDLSRYDRGAYTGEVSGADLAEIGCTVVEVGHAERRRLSDDDATVALKVAAAVRNGLVPVICIGEPADLDGGEAVAFCTEQLTSALSAIEGAPIIVAYEPVWAIGADRPAPVERIRTVCAALAGTVAELGCSGKVIYGGSAGPGALSELGPAVDGLFLGRFAHDPEAVRTILAEATRILETSAEGLARRSEAGSRA